MFLQLIFVFCRYSLKDRKSTRLNSSHVAISYAVFCLKKKKKIEQKRRPKGKQLDERGEREGGGQAEGGRQRREVDGNGHGRPEGRGAREYGWRVGPDA